jgi:hypothetical protein
MEKTSKSRAKKTILVLLFITLIFFIAILLFWEIFKFSIIVKTFNYVVQNIINVTGMSFWLAKGLVIIAIIPFFWAIGEVFKIKFKINIFKKRPLKSYRKAAAIVIVLYIALFFFSMYFFSRGTYFGHYKGEATKYYAMTPEGLRTFDSPGFDPKYGIELKPMTPKMIEQLERAKLGKKPKLVNMAQNIEYFDSITGEPKIWYFKDKEGNYDFFDQPGYHPVYWEELKPISKQVVMEYKEYMRQISERRITERLAEDEKKENERKEIKKKEAEESRRKYIETNIDTSIRNSPDKKDITILVFDKEADRVSSSSIWIKDKIKESIAADNLVVVIDLFNNGFIESGNFEKIYNGNSGIIKDLGLEKSVDFIVLGKKKNEEYLQDPRLGDLNSCKIELEIKIYSALTSAIIGSNIFKEAGVGIDKDKAKWQAINRISDKAKEYIKSKI